MQVYASAYGNYTSQPQTASHNHKLNSSTTKDSQYESSTTTSNNSLATTTTTTLGLSSASVNSSQTKVTSSNGKLYYALCNHKFDNIITVYT